MICTLLAVRGIEKTSNAFRAELCRMAFRLGTNPDFLSAVMSIESGFSASIRNPLSGATGLIQFMPGTAKRLGTTTRELAQMSAEDQLFYMEKYFLPFSGRLKTEEDAYMAVFFPNDLGKSSSNVIASEGDPVYNNNRGLDRNKDGVLTNGDVGDVARSVLAEATRKPPIQVDVDISIARIPPKPSTKAGHALALGASAWIGWSLMSWWQKRSRILG